MASEGLGEVDIVSTETVKPSSPTPRHLLTHRLSWVDQMMPPAHVCVVLFYLGDGGSGTASADIPEKLRRLKRSLSDALALYYPLAGRLDNGTSAVNCTDDGVDFIEARASCPLSTLFRMPEAETVDRLLPCSRRCSMACNGGPLLTVQATAFDCGGLAVGVCISHQVADGKSLAVFLDTWAAVAQGKPDAERRRPLLEMASAFPPLQEMPTWTDRLAELKRRLVVRRFVLDGSKIRELMREKAAEAEAERGSPGHRLTRVQAVCALLWRCLIRAFSREGGVATGEFVAIHAVDLRRRMDPPLPETAFGNVVAVAATPVLLVPNEHVSDDGGGGDSSVNLRRVTEVQTSAAIRKVDSGYIRRTLQVPEGPSTLDGPLFGYPSRGVRVLWFNSMLGFPFYEADFGWGRPAWVARAGSGAVQSSVTLMGRPAEGGGHVDAWVTLGAAEMRRFQGDPELLSLLLTSSDPLTGVTGVLP